MKKFSGKLISGLCAAALAASMMSIAVSAEDGDVNSFEADSSTVKCIGRTYRTEDSLYLTYSASGVEFTCTGSKVRFNLHQGGDPTRVAVYVNGKLSTVGLVSTKAKKPVIDVQLEEGENTVKLIKLSESANSILAIDSIDVDGEAIKPTAAKAHSIEIIGDSITCGYGVDGTLKESFSTKNENAAKTYGYLTAQALDADYSLVSVSGTGIISGYSNGTTKNEQNLMPPVYENLCFTWSWIDGACPKDLEWDFSQYQPEAVVINLGTNDNSYTKGDEAKCKEYADGYVEFIKTVRKNNPDAAIVCALGIMGQELYPSIEQAVEAYKTETGDTNVYAFEFSNQNADANGYGVDYHPSEQSHIEAAEELTAELSELLGWEKVEVKESGMAGFDKASDAEFVDDPNAPEDSSSQTSSSESDADSSSQTASESSADSSTDTSSSKADGSSKANSSSKAASGSSTTNPSTGAAAGLAAVAVLGGAMIAIKKRK